MKAVLVTNEFNQTVMINEDNQKLYSYSNKNETITYNAEIVEGGELSGHWTNYTIQGRVDDIEERMNTWNSSLKLAYASKVNFAASENDPDGSIWKSLVEYVKENQDKFFDEHGDFLKKALIDPYDLIK